MLERIYKTNLWFMILFITVFITVFTVFNIYVFDSAMDTSQHITVCMTVAIYVLFTSIRKKVYLYEDTLVFQKIFSKIVIHHDQIHKIQLNSGFSGYYFALLDEQEEVLVKIYVGLIGDHFQQYGFIDILSRKNPHIIIETEKRSGT